MAAEFKIAVLISGGGTTLKNLIDVSGRNELAAKIELVISSHPEAKGIKYAINNGIALETVDFKRFSDREAFSQKIFDLCRRFQIELVVLGGFLRKLEIPSDFENRVINIHPSLIPAFSGQGFYGTRVHQAVFNFGCKTTGCTAHFVDNQYDHGPIIAQSPVDIRELETPEEIQSAVFQRECELYPAVINQIAKGNVSIDGRRTICSDAGSNKL